MQTRNSRSRQSNGSVPMIFRSSRAFTPRKDRREFASRLLEGTTKITFGQEGGVMEIMYAATGFLLTQRKVYDDIQRNWGLPTCNEQFGRPMVPYFMPLVTPTEQGPWYLADDYAFSHRARAAGYKIFADTTIRLGHIGRYSYSWEDAGGSNNATPTMTITSSKAPPSPRPFQAAWKKGCRETPFPGPAVPGWPD